MEKEIKKKTGVLKYVAAGGAKGIKFEDEPDKWYNPVGDVKEQVIPDMKGKEVEILLGEKENEFIQILVVEKVSGRDEEKAIQTLSKEENAGSESQQKEELDQTKNKKGVRKILHSSECNEGFNYFENFKNLKLDTVEKGPYRLKYASWAEAWEKLKENYPATNFYVHEDPRTGMPVFVDNNNPNMGGFVKVSLAIRDLDHTVHLPVMDHMNRSIPVGRMTTFDINKSIQRALVKAIALHGLGLYIYKGEDMSEDKK